VERAGAVELAKLQKMLEEEQKAGAAAREADVKGAHLSSTASCMELQLQRSRCSVLFLNSN
jgi:hypothetical protein